MHGIRSHTQMMLSCYIISETKSNQPNRWIRFLIRNFNQKTLHLIALNFSIPKFCEYNAIFVEIKQFNWTFKWDNYAMTWPLSSNKNLTNRTEERIIQTLITNEYRILRRTIFSKSPNIYYWILWIWYKFLSLL